MNSKLIYSFCILLFQGSVAVQGLTCKVKQERCDFPFEHNSLESSECVDLDIGDTNSTKQYFCQQNLAGLVAWGLCDSKCLDDDGVPLEFGGEYKSMGVFCKNVPSDCVFPFIYNDVEYKKCTNVGMEDSNSTWCATATDDQNRMIEGRFGLCGECTQDEVLTTDEPSSSRQTEPKEFTISITGHDDSQKIEGSITFYQECPDSKLEISGEISGLTPGLHGFHVHEKADLGNGCLNTGGHFNPHVKNHGGPETEERHVGDFGNIVADDEGTAIFSIVVDEATIFEGVNSILGRAIVVHQDEDDLGTENTTASMTVGSAGARLACALIPDPNPAESNLLLIIIVVVVIIILLIIIAVIVCYCLKKKRSQIHEKVPCDEPDFDYPNGDAIKKSPLYDELSIPFIDASIPPTPRTGRSTERLSFFNRESSIGRSRGSLSNEENYVEM